MKTTDQIVSELNKEVNPLGTIGVNIAMLCARLDFAHKKASDALYSLLSLYQSVGNDVMVECTKVEIKVLARVLASNLQPQTSNQIDYEY